MERERIEAMELTWGPCLECRETTIPIGTAGYRDGEPMARWCPRCGTLHLLKSDGRRVVFAPAEKQP